MFKGSNEIMYGNYAMDLSSMSCEMMVGKMKLALKNEAH